MRFEFEKIKSTIYPAYLHAGDYSIALDPKLISSLKKSSTLENIIQIVAGDNRYLVTMIATCIAASEEQSLLIKRLCKEIESL
jgi:hypothetical protein